jgi:hypothetical protein
MLDVPTKLAILGVLTGAAGYVCKRVTETIEKAKTSLEHEIDSYEERTEHHSIQLGQMSQQVALQTVHRKLSPTSEFKIEVIQEALTVKHTESMARQSSEKASRLIEKLMFGREPFRKEFERLNAAFSNISPQQHIPQNADWTDAAEGKLAVASAAL